MDLFGRALKPGWLTPAGSIAGLVLIDEIEQHLHPELQTRVAQELTATFPDCQFVLTTQPVGGARGRSQPTSVEKSVELYAGDVDPRRSGHQILAR